jgi:hypothetical protein
LFRGLVGSEMCIRDRNKREESLKKFEEFCGGAGGYDDWTEHWLS